MNHEVRIMIVLNQKTQITEHKKPNKTQYTKHKAQIKKFGNCVFEICVLFGICNLGFVILF